MDGRKPKVSVVVPIYNVEKYLLNCIESILGQSYSSLEIILVDDGSTDNSRTMSDRYAKQYDNIQVIHKKNGGLSSARNAGIDQASGKYIVFIDPDDVIYSDYFNRLVSKAEKQGCDAVISGYNKVPGNDKVIPGYELNRVMNGKELVLSSPTIHSNNDLCFVWRNIYKLSLMKQFHIRFHEQVFIGEDVIFNLEYFLRSQRICAIPDILYDYTVNNPNSLMRAKYKPKLESSLIIQYEVRKRLSEQYELLEQKHYRKDMANYYIKNIYSLMLNNLKSKPGVEDMKSELNRISQYEMWSDSAKTIGLLYRCRNWKEYIYYLVLFKLKMNFLMSKI